MSPSIRTVVGIDVGGQRKGFHAVALQGKRFIVPLIKDTDPAAIADWCFNLGAMVVSVDAPCGWSITGSSRLAKCELSKRGIWCFSTPTRQKALQHNFYKWMLNGEKLYECLESCQYNRFDGDKADGLIAIETFPHAIVCAMEGRIVLAKPKAEVRRKLLQSRDYDINTLSNIDYVDAALCAIAADAFCKDNYQKFGNREEGIIIAPKTAALSNIHT